MILGRVSSIRQRGCAATALVCRAGQRRFLSSQGPRDGHAAGAVDASGAGLSKTEILALRQKRKAGTPGGKDGAGAGKKLGIGSAVVLATVAGGGALTIAWQYRREAFNDSLLEKAVNWVEEKVAEMAKPWTDPSSDKLLPDWPLPGVPPGVPPPPTLVLDLDGTLVATVFNGRNGFRSAKRPGLDAFLKEMNQLYEIVLFSDRIPADEVVNKMDPNGYITHRLYREGTKWTNGKHVKDLSCLNRPIERIVILDDNPDCFSLQPENGIKVKKFSLEEGEYDDNDSVLPDLTDFMRALVIQEVPDFRDAIRPYIGKDSSVIVENYNSKVAAVRSAEEAEMNKGLGGFVRRTGRRSSTSQPPRRAALTSKDIVGDAPDTLSPASAAGAGSVNAGSIPLPEENRGALWKRFDVGTKGKEEELKAKSEAFHQAMMRREERQKPKEGKKDN